MRSLTHNLATNYIRFISFFSQRWALFYEFLNEKLTKHKSY